CFRSAVERDVKKIIQKIVRSTPGRFVAKKLFPARFRPNGRDLFLLETLRNKHLGKRCFVLGCGPSLNLQDVEKLRFEYTFACNKIYLLFEKTQWRPSYYSCEDHLLVQNSLENIMSMDRTLKLFSTNVLRSMTHHKKLSECFFYRHLPNHPIGEGFPGGFSYDMTKGVQWGSTITYSLIQMAVYMGFKTIYLLGLDHFYILPEKKCGRVYIDGGEQNHFHNAYRKPGERWHDPQPHVLEQSYAYALEACCQVGVSVFNASRRTMLNIFPRISFDDIPF
ncbi:DUF115 domain-containing protein, partial [Desulfovibrio sp. OttesenSCG-928-A18]|nr:DUF115 domain-containing protein [Desulfovibrio sp. OttesenSCG-928-A18]